MKWFRHDIDMHTDLKIQNLISKYGLEGYAVWNLCLEMVGKEGARGKIDGQLRWHQGILRVAGWSDEGKDKVRLDDMLKYMGEVGLICPKSLKYGNLSIPKFIKRIDDYERKKLRTMSEHSTDNISLEQIRTDKNRIDKALNKFLSLKNWVVTNSAMKGELYRRHTKPIKKLIEIAGTDEQVAKVLEWANDFFKKMNCNWTIETVIKYYPEFEKKTDEGDGVWTK